MIIWVSTRDAEYDSEASAADIRNDYILLHRIVLDRPAKLRLLYWRILPSGNERLQAGPVADGGLQITRGATVSFDTYFNGLFERHWRLSTSAGALTLALRTYGRAALRIWRRSSDCGQALLHEQEVAGAAEIILPDDAAHFRQAGLLWFDLTALDEPAILMTAGWWAAGNSLPRARLGVVICTFNREAELGAVLAAVADDDDVKTAVSRVVVVNQGRPGLSDHHNIAAVMARLGSRLPIIDQANLGAAGGFGRGPIEALDDQAVTHACFLDDDVRVEPESLRRMAAFFTLASDNVAIGGHMLDSISPTTLYEAGAVVKPNWVFRPLHFGLDLSEADTLDALLDPYAMHYNGWWMFGFPKRWIDRVGMPQPCFIRGGDIEFGRRLHDASLPSIAMPGLGVWHEPFYLKTGGWRL